MICPPSYIYKNPKARTYISFAIPPPLLHINYKNDDKIQDIYKKNMRPYFT